MYFNTVISIPDDDTKIIPETVNILNKIDNNEALQDIEK